MSKQYILEWSQSTNNFHIQTVASLCANNQEAFINDKPMRDYVVLMVGEFDAINRMADSWRSRIEERDRIRAQKRIRAC